jgi:hypothetical protein
MERFIAEIVSGQTTTRPQDAMLLRPEEPDVDDPRHP